jgi:CRP-like cAMP-binding protein
MRLRHLLQRLRPPGDASAGAADAHAPPAAGMPDDAGGDLGFFAAGSAHRGGEAAVVDWAMRAADIDARPIDPARGAELLRRAWGDGSHEAMSSLDASAIGRMARFTAFVRVSAGQAVVRQDEHANFMVVPLSGSIVVERLQPWGERLRLAQARPGDLLGEMSLLDSGIRFSACTTLTDCDLAVLGADGLDAMMGAEPETAARLVGLIARKLSLRLRAVSARLSTGQT